jgi:L-2-hydroxyglutarate oxidase LhgO
MFPQLDRELRFGYQKNGSLVVATNKKELEILDELLERGKTNGVQNLRIIQKEELFKLEPALHPDVIAALHAPDAGNVIPYEFAIALAENAVDNGVELRIRREVTGISKKEDGYFQVDMRHWEPKDYVVARKKLRKSIDGSETKEISLLSLVLRLCISFPASILAIEGLIRLGYLETSFKNDTQMVMTVVAFISSALVLFLPASSSSGRKRATVLKDIVDKCPPPVGVGDDGKVKLADMFTGGSGSRNVVHGETVGLESVKTQYVVNAAGSFSDQIARMIGDDSFYIKPRIGDYILLNRNQGYLTHHTIFPCPDPVLGKGVLVQTTLWGNLILGPTARDMHNPEARDMSNESVQEYILSKCKKLCPYFDPKETIHAFAGARSKSSRGDWIIEPSSKDANFIHVAGIDSPGLAGAPAISLHVVELLKSAGLKMPPNVTFNPNRAPIITPKSGLSGLKMGPVGKNDSNGLDEAKMASNVVCKCEKVTELEVVRALHRSLPIDSTQGIRKRTRAGMGHCQGDADNYFCEGRVKAIIARENGTSCDEVGGRPWPATSTLSQRWVYKDDEQKEGLQKRMGN